MKPSCVILGGGGHARVLVDSLQRADAVHVRGILDSNRDLWGTACLGVSILGGDDMLADLVSDGISLFTVGVGGVGSNDSRQRLFELGLTHQLRPLTLIHPSATCSRWATLGPGCQLLPGSIVNAGAELGVNVIVNSGAIVEHDCRLGDHVHVATGARLSGTVRVGNRAHVGAGAVIRQSINVAEDAVIGAGAVVVRDVGAGQVVVGNPARVLEYHA
jgi:sugar O-acyltransferase (sialic acid O-acetyltransferase NeuD family)